MSEIAPDGPFQMSMSVTFTNEDGGQANTAYDFPPGKVPTDEDVVAAIEEMKANDIIQQHAMRPMTRHEFVKTALAERTGFGGFAVPGADKFRLFPADQ